MDEAGPLPSPGVVLSHGLDRYYGPIRHPPDRTRLHQRLIRAHRFPDQHRSAGAGEGFPSSRIDHPTVPLPLPRGVLDRCASRIYTASMAFALNSRARLPLAPANGASVTRRQDSLDVTDRPVASPKRAFDAGLRPRAFPPEAASLLPGTLAFTETGLTPAGRYELMFRSGQRTAPPPISGHTNGTLDQRSSNSRSCLATATSGDATRSAGASCPLSRTPPAPRGPPVARPPSR